MPLFQTPKREASVNNDIPPTPPRAPIKRSPCFSSDNTPPDMDTSELDNSSESSPTTVLFDDESCDEIFELSLECLYGVLETVQVGRRMNDGYWDDENARRYFVAYKINAALRELNIIHRNLRDARKKILGDTLYSDLSQAHADKDYVQADFYMQDQDGMTHHEIFKSVIAAHKTNPAEI